VVVESGYVHCRVANPATACNGRFFGAGAESKGSAAPIRADLWMTVASMRPRNQTVMLLPNNDAIDGKCSPAAQNRGAAESFHRARLDRVQDQVIGRG
jgi:hypothetical protein